jgi:hypothetical protein
MEGEIQNLALDSCNCEYIPVADILINITEDPAREVDFNLAVGE